MNPSDRPVVVFDLGGVLVALDASWPARLGIDPEDAVAWLAQSEAYAEFERGRMGHERVFRAAAAELGGEADAWAEAYTSWVVGLLPGALALVERVPGAACLSNSNPLHWSVFDPDRLLRAKLGRVLASHHLGARKPERAVFERASELLGTSDVVLLDDWLPNVDAARRFGWQAEHVVGTAAAAAALEDLGLL